MCESDYEFWKMILSSPVGIALASGLGAAIVTLIVSLLRNKHEFKLQNEQRYFNLKLEAYRLLFKSIETIGEISKKAPQECNKEETKKLLIEIQFKLAEIISYVSLFVPNNIYKLLKELNNNLDIIMQQIELFSDGKENKEIAKEFIFALVMIKEISTQLSIEIRKDIQQSHKC